MLFIECCVVLILAWTGILRLPTIAQLGFVLGIACIYGIVVLAFCQLIAALVAAIR